MLAFQAFMTGLIDYAGLFPPAGLPLPAAITNFHHYRQQPEQWMLGRFIVPVGHLAELATYAHLFQANNPTRLAVIGRGGQDGDTFFQKLEEDLAMIAAFQASQAPAGQIDLFEVRLPRTLFPSVDNVRLFVAEVGDLLAPAGLTPFYEAPFDVTEPGWFEALFDICAGCSLFNRQQEPGVAPAGVKIRCGGLSPAAFPTSVQLAYALSAAHDNPVPLKCTAGLHHPIRHFSPEVQTKMHGFLNLFAAGLLTHCHNLPLDTIQAILEDEEPSHFTFDPTGFAWQNYRMTTSEIANLRQQLLISYGSCSFDDPCHDLRSLNLL